MTMMMMMMMMYDHDDGDDDADDHANNEHDVDEAGGNNNDYADRKYDDGDHEIYDDDDEHVQEYVSMMMSMCWGGSHFPQGTSQGAGGGWKQGGIHPDTLAVVIYLSRQASASTCICTGSMLQ